MKWLLLPNKYKKVGWVLLLPATLMGIILMIKGFEGIELNGKALALWHTEIFGERHFVQIIETNLINTIVGIFFIIGGLFVCFSKEKVEDEYISNLRLNSLQWAVIVNYLLLLLGFIFVYGTAFFNVMVYNMFTILIIFIVRFNYVLYAGSKSRLNEE